MKKILLLSFLFLGACAKPTHVVKSPVPVVTQDKSIRTTNTPTAYILCAGKMFKAVLVTTNGVEVVYRCPDEAGK